MSREKFAAELRGVLLGDIALDGNFSALSHAARSDEHANTNAAFARKWQDYKDSQEKPQLIEMQKSWYLQLYGFASEGDFAAFLRTRKYIFDAGCGPGYKTAWFAALAPDSIVIGMDFSDAARTAAASYRDVPNLFFLQGDIAEPVFRDGSIDYVSCDQVIMHTQDPEKTFAELTRITEPAHGEFACYFYAKKALPRELLDDYFRLHCTDMSHEELMDMSDQLTELGKRLSELNVTFDAPAIPALGIKGGVIDLQRFIYWNFLKCYWNEGVGRETSTMINFDWYSPANARRYSRAEVERMVDTHRLGIRFFHQEEACYSGRFAKMAA